MEPERGPAHDEEEGGPGGEAERVEALGDVEVALGGQSVLDDLDGALLAHRHLREHEGDGDQDAARGDERDHVGHPGHQPLAQLGQGAGDAVDLGGQPALHRRAGGHGFGRQLRVGPPLGGDQGRLLDQRRAVGDALLDADVDDRLAGEPAGVLDREVVGEDHRVGRGDLGGAQGRGAGRALGLDLHHVTGGLCGVLEGLGCHVGVRDAGRARRDADEGE
jgi:hypothetical protein